MMKLHAFITLGIMASLVSMALATPGTATFYTNYVREYFSLFSFFFLHSFPKFISQYIINWISFAASACYGNTPEGTMIAAASDPLWNGGKICGTYFKVTCTGPTNPVPHPCTGRSVTVKIVDHCPGCGGTLDLSREAFTAIANPVAGIIKIDYTQ